MNGVVKSVGSLCRSLGRLVEDAGCGLQGRLAYRETLNKSQTLSKYKDSLYPTVKDEVFVAPNASVIGDVTIGKGSSVWYGCVIRGDVNSVTIGEMSNIQDNVMVHVAKHNAAGIPRKTVIGSGVTVGHGATIHAATVEDGSVIGMGAVIMDGAVVEKGAIVAAGSLVVPGTVVKSREVWAGSPAACVRKVSDDEVSAIEQAAVDYSNLGAVHAAENCKTFGEIELDRARRWDRQTRDPDYDLQQGVEREIETRELVPTGYVQTQ